jgi:nicotinamidase-related amidase
MADLENEIPGWLDGKWEVPPDWSFTGRPALVINHMQMGIAGTGKFSGAPYAQEKKAMEELNTIAMQKKLIAAFRERKLPVIFVAVIPDPINYLPKWGHIFEMSRLCAPKGGLETPDMRWGVEIIPELGKLPEEPLFCHTGHSPLTGNHLEEYLRYYEVHDIVLTGWTAHSTLYNSLLQFTNHWYSVVVPRDATGAPERDMPLAQMALDRFMWMYGLVTTVDDVISRLPN